MYIGVYFEFSKWFTTSSGDPRISAMGVLTRAKRTIWGGLGACYPRKMLDFRCSEIVSGAIWK